MHRKDYLSLVAVHTDSWLLFGVLLNPNDRKRLINNLPTLFEVVTCRKAIKDNKPSMDLKSKSKNDIKDETSQSETVEYDSSIETSQSQSMDDSNVETNQSQSVDDSNVETLDSKTERRQSTSDLKGDTSLGETVDDSEVETLDSKAESPSVEHSNVETSDSKAETSPGHSVHDLKVKTIHSMADLNVETSDSKAETRQSTLDFKGDKSPCETVDDSKVGTLDSMAESQSVKHSNVETPDSKGETSQSTSDLKGDTSPCETVDDLKVETLDSKAETSDSKAETSPCQSVHDLKVETLHSMADSTVETLYSKAETSLGQSVHDLKVETLHSKAETSHIQSFDDTKVETSESDSVDDSKVEPSDLKVETSQNQSMDDLKVETLDSEAETIQSHSVEDSNVETIQSQSVDDSNVQTIQSQSVDSNVETLDSEAETSQSTLDIKGETSPGESVDDPKVETLYSKDEIQSVEDSNVDTSYSEAETSPGQSVHDLKVETLYSEAETSHSHSVDDLKVETSERHSIDDLKVEFSDLNVETSPSQSVGDLMVETLDSGTETSQNTSDFKGETSPSESADDLKVETLDSRAESQVEDSNVETLDLKNETSQSQSVEDSKADTLDSKAETCQHRSMDDSKVETLDSEAASSQSQSFYDSNVDFLDSNAETRPDDSEVETLDCVLKAQELKEEGNKLFQKRDYDGAMLKYGEAIKILPEDHVEVSHVRANMASCYMQLEPANFAIAIQECDLALSVTPDHSKALLKRARCYEALNKLDLALKDVSMVSEIDPKNPMASEISDKLSRTLEGKGLTTKDSGVELRPDYVEPVEVSPAFWAALWKTRVKKIKKRNQVFVKSEVENVETEKKINNVVADKGKEQEKVIIEDKVLDISGEDVKRAVKFVYSHDIRLAKVPLNCTLFQLREVVHERFPSLRAVHIKYKDQEGDLVTITTDEELRMSDMVARSLETRRFYVVEVSPKQDLFFGRLVEKKKLKSTANSFKTKVNGKGGCKVEDWMIEFAQLFKIQTGFDSDTCLNLQELGMKLNSEAMEEVVTSDAAQGPFDKAAQQFQELAARSLLKLGNVHMSGARKRLRESSSEQVKNAYESVQKELAKAKENYEKAMKIKPDLFEVFLVLGLLQFEEARLSWYYVLVSQLDLKTWPCTDVLQLYQSAERNIIKSMEMSKEEGRLKSWVDVLLCVLLYERSIMEYKLELPLWLESLEDAMEKFELAGTCKDDVIATISEDNVGGNTLRDLRFHMKGIIHIFNEIDEAKQWRNGILSDHLEDILKKRTANIFHVYPTFYDNDTQ